MARIPPNEFLGPSARHELEQRLKPKPKAKRLKTRHPPQSQETPPPKPSQRPHLHLVEPTMTSAAPLAETFDSLSVGDCLRILRPYQTPAQVGESVIPANAEGIISFMYKPGSPDLQVAAHVGIRIYFQEIAAAYPTGFIFSPAEASDSGLFQVVKKHRPALTLAEAGEGAAASIAAPAIVRHTARAYIGGGKGRAAHGVL